MVADPALSGYGVVRGPGLFPAAANTVVANLGAAGEYPVNTPVSELAAMIGTLSYQGLWNASTNTPTIVSSVGTNGYYYVVNVAGTTSINGISNWDVGDWIIFNSTTSTWQQIGGGVISNADINTALGNPISLGVGFTTAGSGAITLTSAGATNVTLPTTGTLATTAASLQVANNLSDLNNASTARTNLSLGTAAQQNVSAFLQTTNNLSDVPTPATARTNLGLGTAATRADSFFLQVANNLSDLNNAGTARTNLGLGTAAVQNVGVFAQVANNLSDLASASTARTNLGLGTAATQASTVFAQVANNLSDLTNASTARGNLGLGTAATLNVGTGANNIVQLTAGGILPAVDGSQLTNLPAAGGGLLAANNLSDVASASTSRTNLGLGTAAVQNVGAFAQVANNLSDLAAVATARVNLNIDKYTSRGDATYAIQVTDKVVALTATLTTPRAWTLPAANAVNAGQSIIIIDLAAGVSSTNYITITRAGADTINGTTTVNLTAPYGYVTVTSNGTSAWETTVTGLEQGGTGAVSASAARTNLGLAAIASSGSATDLSAGTTAVARGGTGAGNLNAFILAGTTNTATVGYTYTAPNLGNITSFTVNPATGNYQYGTNNGAFTLTASASDGAVTYHITNNGSAGAITFSGFTVGSSTGDALTTTNTSKFRIRTERINGVSTYQIQALQ